MCLAAALPAQQPRHRPTTTPLYYQGLNTYRMYHLRGADTLGQPVSDLSVERREWRAQGAGLRGIITELSLNWLRAQKSDTFSITPQGQVVSINGKATIPRGRHDLLLRFPANGSVATAGDTWTDTIDFGGNDGPIGQRYTATRTYRVARLFDSLGTRVMEVTAEGEVRYRDGYWADSVAHTFLWLDVVGPVHEMFHFDLSRGQLMDRRWQMDLRGRGGLPDTPSDTIPAGLLSSDDTHAISLRRYADLARGLPGRDTTYIVSAGIIFLHTVKANGSRVSSGMARNDGLVGTAETRFAAGRPVEYHAFWTDSAASDVRHALRTIRDSLVESGARSCSHPLPTSAWAIADYAMNEHLVPVLLALPHDGVTRSLTIYRPYAGKWDSGAAWVRPLTDLLLAEVTIEGSEKATYLLFSGTGQLLYGENSDPRGANRVPRLGSPERAIVEKALQAVRH